MIITSLINKIDGSILISNQFGIIIRNPKEDEIYDIKSSLRESSISNIDYFDQLKTVIFSPYYQLSKGPHKSLDTMINCIIDNIICIDIDESITKNNILLERGIVNPTCEHSYEYKILRFCEFLDKSVLDENRKSTAITSYYSTNYADRIVENQLLSTFYLKSINPLTNRYTFKNHIEEFEYKTKFLIEIGEKIDGFIKSENDFMLLEYILDILNYSPLNTSAALLHLFSLIELLLGKSNESLNSICKNKLKLFYDNKDFDNWSSLVYKIRNKISHGEYDSLHKLCNRYFDEHMKNCELDLYEFRKINWVLSSLQYELEEIISKVLLGYLNEKEKMINLKTS